MKQLLTSVLFFLSVSALAQGSAMADLKFEEAEIAFNNYDYETTIKKLNDFDKLIGNVKDKSLYLRIISQDKLFDPSILYESEDQFNLLVSLRKNTNAYLKAMESSGLDDRYREVYSINEKLQNYKIKDRAAWLKEKQLKEEQLIKQNEESLAYYQMVAPKIDSWEWCNEIKLGENIDNLKTQFKSFYRQFESFKGKDSDRHKKIFYNTKTRNKYGDISLLENIKINQENIIFEYEVLIYKFKEDENFAGFDEKVKKVLQQISYDFGIEDGLGFDFDEEKAIIIIDSQFSKSRIEIFGGYGDLRLKKSLKQ